MAIRTITFIIGVACAIGLGIAGRYFDPIPYYAGLALLPFVVVLLIGIVRIVKLFGDSSYRWQYLRWFYWTFLGVVVFGVGGLLRAQDFQNAITYAKALIPRLEQYRQDNGYYPANVGSIIPQDELPILLRKQPFYRNQGEWFELSISERCFNTPMVLFPCVRIYSYSSKCGQAFCP